MTFLSSVFGKKSNKKSKQELEAGLKQQQQIKQQHMQQAAAAVAAERQPFGNVTSNQNTAKQPVAAAMQSKKIEHMGFRAAPAGFEHAQVGRSGPKPIVDYTGNAGFKNTATSELSDFGGEIDERVEALHDVRGHLDPLAVQSFVDQQIKAHLSHAYADMDIKLKQAAHYKAKVLAGTSLEKEASTTMGLMGPGVPPMMGTAGPMMGTAGPMGSSRPMPAPPGCDPIFEQEYAPLGCARSAGSSASRAYGGGPVWGTSAAPSAACPQLLARAPSTGVYAM